ncbi:MAG: hypothetical protein H7X86_11195, partial [Gorillibacterium sp.]|nr:hypothetical protein [Gorillibacterium sp.]
MAQFLGGWEPIQRTTKEGLVPSDWADEAAEQQQVKSENCELMERQESSKKNGRAQEQQQVKNEDCELMEWQESGENSGDGEEYERIGSDYVRRTVAIIESSMERQLQLNVTMAERVGIGKGDDRIWRPLLEKLAAVMEGCTTVLIFTNSRRLCERLTLRLNDFFGGEIARSHHGSVSREQRLEVERMLKAGELRAIVATSSLELGIDVGHIDLVIQIDSPKSAAAAIQRFGRAGHAVGGVSRGILLARSRGELAEAA